jgi:hypothetical protein
LACHGSFWVHDIFITIDPAAPYKCRSLQNKIVQKVTRIKRTKSLPSTTSGANPKELFFLHFPFFVIKLGRCENLIRFFKFITND